MSTLRFRLALGAETLTVTTLVPETSLATMPAWKRAAAFLRGNQGGFKPTQVKVFVREDSQQTNGLPAWLAQALQYIRSLLSSPSQPAHLEVTLGASHAWVGVIDIPEGDQGRLSDAERRAFIDAWVSSQWNQDPAHGVIRTQRVGQSHRHLVGYIPQSLLATLQALCDAEGFLLVGCHPQLIDQLTDSTTQLQSGNSYTIAAAIEHAADGGLHPLAQFVVFDSLGLRSVLRFWMPDGHRSGTPSALEFAQPMVTRLSAQLMLAQPAPFQISVWPELPAEVARA